MLRTKFHGNRITVSGKEKIFEGFFSTYGSGGHVVHVTQMPQTS